MKENKLIIQINKPVSVIFEFLLNPKNTPLWVENFVVEQTNEWPVKIGTIYRNQNKAGTWAQYTLIVLEKDKMFEMLAEDNNYHVKYTFTPINENACELEYYEWVENGELEEPFTLEILNKLSTALAILAGKRK